MLNFCTLFDSYYIHKGLALYFSLENQCQDFHLYVMAFDRESFTKLKELNLPHMSVECMCNYEDSFFQKLMQERTKAEYCWTCGPFVILHFLTSYKLPSVTYLDSDLYFIGNPQVAFDEIGSSSIAITEQGISEERARLYGKYCVQFMYFKNDVNSITALEWWRDSCFDWCYQRFEDGKFGDQKYLDLFPKLFNGVYVIKNPGVGLAPWNVHRYTYKDNGKIIELNGIDYKSVFFHMHGLRSDIEKTTLKMTSNDCFIYNKDKHFFFNSYAELTICILNKYFTKDIQSYSINGIPQWRYYEMILRGKLNKIPFLRNLYHSLLGTKEQNHGSKIM